MADEEGGRDGPVERTDRISRLPNEIREFILSHLPIPDAVTTSALARNWRYSWTKAEQLNLNFGEDMEEQMAREVEEYLSGDEYCRLVGGILSSHVGPIRKLVMGPVWRDNEGEVDARGRARKGWRYLEGDLTTWLQILSGKGIKDLTIHFRPGVFSPNDVENLDMSSSIFDCLELSLLSLGNCKLRDSVAFRGFPNLVRLDLCEVDIYNDILEKILASCPLEELFLDRCIFMSGRTPISAPHLKIFKVVYDEGYPCYLKFSPKLKVAAFKMEAFDEETDSWNLDFIDILGIIPIIEDFTFDCELHKPSGSDIIPKMLPEMLDSLKSLTLRHFNVSSVDHMSIMLCIIKSSPHLRNMSIKLIFEPWGCNNAALANLKTMGKEEIKTSTTTLSVTVRTSTDVKRIRAELAFISSLLLWCPILQKLEIKSCSSVASSVELELSKALEQFGKFSSRPKIVHSLRL